MTSTPRGYLVVTPEGTVLHLVDGGKGGGADEPTVHSSSHTQSVSSALAGVPPSVAALAEWTWGGGGVSGDCCSCNSRGAARHMLSKFWS